MKTTTISLRVPLDFKSELLSICNTKGVTMSDYCLTKLTPNNQIAPINAKVLHKLTIGGKTVNNEFPIELSQFLGATGGLMVGIIVYNALKENLAKNNSDWTDEKIQAITISAAVASTLISGVALHEITKNLGVNGK